MMKNNIKELKQKALNGDLAALEELRKLGALSGNKSKYSMAPVSYAQRRLWFIDKMDKSPAYNLSAAIILDGCLNTEALKKAFEEIISRHEILRTVFVETDGVPYQRIYDNISFNLVVEDISNEVDINGRISGLIKEEGSRCFDLSKGPLVAGSLYKTEDKKHLLLFNMHHIISDGWSIGVLISELTRLYNSFSKNEKSPLEPLNIQYKDYVTRHTQILKNDEKYEHREYWMNKFSGELPVTEMPADFKRPLYKTFSGKMYEVNIDENLHSKIKELCRQNGVSSFMFLVSAINILINKCSGKEDIVVGSPISGREQKNLENQIGFYVNTIPLRNAVDNNLSFKTFLANVKNTCIEAYDHQVYPYDLLIEDLKLERDTSRNPLIEIMVSLQELNTDNILFDGITTTIIKPEIVFGKFDLHFHFEESPEEIKLGIVYNPDLYMANRIKRYGNHFLELLQNIVSNPDEVISRLEIISPEEKGQILKEFNNTASEYPRNKTIAELYEEMAELYPDKPAIVYKGKPLTYDELNKKANSLASYLQTNYKIKPDEPVAIVMDRSHDLIIAILGVLKAGGAYLPIDTQMPVERINIILKDVKTRVVLTDTEQKNNSFESGSVINITKEYLSGIESTANICTGKKSSNLAYILYTSGSTGTPKGSMIEDKSVIRLVRNTNYICFNETDKMLSTSSISFDATTLDIWGMLLNGGTLYLENTEDYLDPEKFKHYISGYGISKMLLSTGLFVKLFEADQQNSLKLFEGLKELLAGGDRLPARVSNSFIELYPGIKLLNGYGPTENTTFTTVYSVTESINDDVPIGKPISNTTVYIINEYGNLCPVGIPGELYTGGDGVSRGYINNPDLNKQRFVKNPFNSNDILYRTGDIAVWNEDGNISFIGRTDDQVKIRGYRIEAGEIENIAVKYNGIINTKVIVLQEADQKELALYYTSGIDISNEDLRGYLKSSLPEYMLPKYYTRMEKFPLNQNGKVDYKNFPVPEISSEVAVNKYEPASQAEKALAKIFRDILSVNSISADDNFFSLGGHSLKAIRVVSAIQKELSVKITLKEFFANPDISSLAAVIVTKKREELGVIPVIKEAEYYNLSHAQKRLWVLDKIEKSKSTYNIPLALRINEEIDFDFMQSAFNDMVKKHESLRTIFIEKDSAPFQKIINGRDIPVILIDFSKDTNPEESALNYVKADAQKPFTLSEYPLIRLNLIKTAESKYILFLNIHHIICDGWSLNVMIEELFGGYKNYLNKTGNMLPAPSIQYKDYSYWLNDKLAAKEDNTDRQYWLKKLSGDFTPLDIPSDFRRPAVKTYDGDSVYYTFSKELKKELDTFNIGKRSSLFMTLTAALKILLYKYSGKEDIIIGTPVAGRNHPDLENQIGYYVNTLALRDQINPEKSFAELLEEIKKTATDSYTHQMYPFDKIVEELKPERDTSRSPLFDIMIVLQNFNIAYGGVFSNIEEYKVPMNISKYDMSFNYCDTGDKLELFIEYNTNLYKRERIEQIITHTVELLKSVINNPVQKIKSINILSEAEEDNVLRKYNDTSAKYPDDKTIVQLFEETAAKYPDNIAIVFKDKTLTYSELNSRSNQLARCIRKAHNMIPGEPVGVLVPPSENMAVILLAIIKSGGAYVPMDTSYPDERINNILSDSKLNIIITTEGNGRIKNIVDEVNPGCKILTFETMLYQEEETTNLTGTGTEPDTNLYIIFTSGSTGRPKGCLLSHRNLVRLFINDKSHFDFTSADVWTMAHSYCFDYSVWEMYGALLFGGKLIIPERHEVRDISAFVELVKNNKVTVLSQTPGAFYKFIDTFFEKKPSLSVRYVIFAGDKLNPSKLAGWIKYYSAEKVKLINMYGITETTIHTTYHRISDEEINTSDGSSNVGVPLPETKVYILDNNRMLVPQGVYGEIYVAGTSVSKGYMNRPELTAERFIQNPHVKDEIIYKSGDIARWNYNGDIEYLDRSDNQVQIRGFRVEITEIELQLKKIEAITDVIVMAINKEGTKELAAYIVSDEELKINQIKGALSAALPEYMIPSFFIKIDRIPLTTNGKLDRKALPPPVQNIATGEIFETPANQLEAELLTLWQDVLSLENISIHDNFFDLGGNSILLVKLHGRINSKYPGAMELTDLFTKSRISEQAAFISKNKTKGNESAEKIFEPVKSGLKYHDVAIVGMASRIGNCQTPDEFWNDLRMGVDFIGTMPESRIPDIKDLSALYNIKEDSFRLREYCYLNEVDKFDYGFFKLSPGEASLIDPGQRMFMETAYHALEDAGYGGKKLWGSRTGIYIGASDNLGEYARFIEASDKVDPNLLLAAQTPSILASRLAYHLNLKGPALLVDTACSSSLVAVHLACQSIREGKIDSAIVGGIKLHLLPIDSGSRLEIDSTDSRGHSFDDSANGTGGGEGVIAIFIKPLEKAIEDKDNIYAVIKGSEINQDGNSIGITAPDADAQADAIEKAWIDAGIDPKTVSFIETHGTATKLGDPIEIDGITKAFRRYTTEKNICAIGAVKANTGHLDTAAGLAGLLKSVLSLKNKQLTPLVHFKTPNRNINFEESPVYINKELAEWKNNGSPLRCGISSFGLSGTNCHVVLEETVMQEITPAAAETKHLFVLSSRSKEGLAEYVKKIKKSLYKHVNTDPENICFTLSTGRGHYSHRLAIIFNNINELKKKLALIINEGLVAVEKEGIYCNSFRTVASNKKTLSAGEITENDIQKLSDEINAALSSGIENLNREEYTAQCYVKGADVQWEDYYKESSPAKVSLPGYPFESKRCWVTLREKENTNQSINTVYGNSYENIFLSNCILDTPAVAVYSNIYNTKNWLLNDHRVMDIPTLVGTSYLQMAYEAGKNHFSSSSNLCFEDFYLLQPLSIREDEDLEVLTSIYKSDENTLSVEVNSKIEDNKWLSYAKYKVSEIDGNVKDILDVEAIKTRCTDSREVTHGDKKISGEVVSVSDKWNCLNKLYWNEEEYLAELMVPDSDKQLASEFSLYPPMIDAALSFAINEPGYLPYSFGKVELRRGGTDKIYSYVKKQASGSPQTLVYNVTLAEETGNIIAVFENFALKKITSKKTDNYFHELVWKEWPLKEIPAPVNNNIAVLYSSFCDPEFVEKLNSLTGITPIEVVEDNYGEVFNKLAEHNITKVIYLIPEHTAGNVKFDICPECALTSSLYSVFNMAKYLAVNISSGIDILFVGKNVNEVSKQELQLNTINNSVAGLGQVLQRECPNVNCKFLDYDEHTSAEEIVNEINSGFSESYYYRALRNGTRFIREIKTVNPEEKETRELTYKAGGVYVITGGTGGIGLELAHYIAKHARVKLMLINRSEFPAKDKWEKILGERKDEKLCRKIEKLLEIEKDAEGIWFYSADAGDHDQLEAAVNKIKKDHGRINGVIHAAGVAGDGFIFNKSIEKFREVIKSKIHGTIYLYSLLKEDKPDFFIMTSALTAILPTSGQSDYTAANSFMDAYSASINKSGINAISINLTAWKETGMAYDYGVTDDGVFKSLTTEDGVREFGKIIQKNINSVILGETDLSFLDSTEGLPFYMDSKPVTKKKQPAARNDNDNKKQVSLIGRESRVYSAYEKTIANVWGAVLGYQEINVSDNYYDLGGDSIHAIKINSLLEKQLKIQVTIGDLFNHLTIAELAEYLEEKSAVKNDTVIEDAASYSILPAVKRDYYPVSSAQRRLYILDKLTKDRLSYHLPGVWDIKGKLDVKALVEAFNKIISRHEILRTSFELVGDEPVQVIKDKIEFTLPAFTMGEPEAREYIREFVKSFDLGIAPLFRAEIIILSEQEHLLLFDAHHIIMDAYAIEILKKELFGYYEGIEPAPLKIQYKDYSEWQLNYYKSKEALEKKAYWLEQFQGELPVINLPLDYPRTANQSAEAGVYTLCIDEKLTSEIKRMSAGNGISTFMILLSVYNIVLQKYTQQDDITIGVYSMGRDNEELSSLLGMFINNLPVRAFPRDEISVIEFLNKVKNTTINAFSNQDYPFDELIGDLNIKRDLNRSPLFDVVFSYMNFELSESKNAGLLVSDYRSETVISSEYDLMLYGLEAEDKIYITIKYKKSLFKKESIEKFARHFTGVTEIITANKGISIGDINLLQPEEIKELEAYNTAYKKITKKTDVIDLTTKSFEKNVDKVALICKDRIMTYGELNSRINKLANYLRNQYLLKPDDLVGIMTDRSEAMVISMMAVIKSGAAYVGIDNTYPQKRIEYILDNSKVKIVLTEKGVLNNIAFKIKPGIEVIDINDSAISKQDAAEPAKVTSPADLAYIIYTSGSTGDPKGVAITHKNLSVFLHWCLAEFKSTVYDIMYASTSYCFDISIYEIFHSLAAGKTIRILKSAMEIPLYLGTDINVLVNTVPSLVLAIKDDLKKCGYDSIKAINLAGEQIPQVLINEIDCTKMEVRNFYGPSEDTTYSTMYRFRENDGKVLIGKPISNTQIYIVDRNLKLVPPGHRGEICLSGDGLARGYLFNDELTDKKFIKNPFGKGRLYRTGDLGRWTATGDIDYLGRIDRQVKIRGFRIELGEIETHITNYPAVENAVVIAYEKGTDKDLTAYIIAKEGLNITELKAYLGRMMPAFMVPVYFVIIDSFPLLPNGKVDYKTLPAPQPDVNHIKTNSAEVLNETEEVLSGIWKEVLAVETLSKYDSFFDIGGHSLKALRLISKINNEFVSNCALSDIFEYPTISQFACIINAKKAGAEEAILPLPKAEYYDVSHAQRRLWIIDRVDKNSAAYNIPVVYRIKSGLDVDALQKSFASIINKHESLRTSFVEIEGEPKQRISEVNYFKINLKEVTGEKGFEEDSRELVFKAITEPFNLGNAPLIKLTLLKSKGEDDYILIINVHHIVLDEWSINILAENLTKFYDHYTGKNLITDDNYFLPESIQYKEYSQWHNKQIEETAQNGSTHKQYWLDMFKEPVQCLDLPSDFARPKEQSYEGKTESFTLPAELSEKLRKLCSKKNTTLFVTTLALFNVLFSKYTKQNDIVIGTPVANRDKKEIQNQIGFFINTLALRNQTNNAESFSTLLGRVKKNTLDALNHQLYPFDMLVDELKLPRDLSRSPLFTVMLISQTPAEGEIKSSAGLKMKSVEFDYPVSKFDLSVSYYEDNMSIKYFFEYNTALFRKERIENMFNHFACLVESVMADTETSIADLKIVSGNENERLYSMSAGNHVQLKNNSVVEAIEKQAEKSGDKLAVVFRRNRLTYGEVNSKANQLARYLIKDKNIKPGDYICVMLDRSEWSVISMLAIFKSGGIYVPVDSTYPKNRIEYILSDSKGKLVITNDELKNLLPSGNDTVVIDEIENQISGLNKNNVGIKVSADDGSAAYAIYTSGSTGNPKGVLGTHKCLLNLVEWQEGLIEGGYKTLQYAPHGFDVSVQEILYTLASAGTLYMIDNEMRYKMNIIADLIEKEGIEFITMPYSALNIFLGELEDISKLKSLKHIVTSGEQPYINGITEKLLRTYTNIKYHNQYGPSETHVVTSYTLTGNDETLPGKVPAGKPINNTQIYLLDKNMEFVPEGIPGELYIGGYNIAIGYMNKPELTKEAFIPNPFGEGTLYKTGDMARWDYAGELEFLGRDDGQVKVRGYRIELGEIESCMLKYPGLKEAAVKLIDEEDNKEIAAYYTCGEIIEITSLKEFLSSLLPGYMIPGYFVMLENIPHTSSGKADYRSLPLPNKKDNLFLTEYVSPEGEIETVIASVWEEILQIENISVHDNFFEIGGNSIKAIRLMSKVQKRLGKKTFLNLIFKNPTIRKMATVISGMDERMKNLDIDYILLNGERERKIFFLPPGIGYSFSYMEFAKYFDEYSVYGLNFIESDDPAGSIADILVNLQSEGEFYLFGHSAGGNMAFDVAVELRKRGRKMGGIILLDTYRQLEILDWNPDEYLNDATLYIEQNHAEFLDEEIKEASLRKIIAYRKYLNARIEEDKLECPIIQIEATDEIAKYKHNMSRRAWSELTPVFEVFEGFGGHMDMLKQPNMEKNAALTKKLLVSLINKS